MVKITQSVYALKVFEFDLSFKLWGFDFKL
jgi:hypothetical protein